MQLNQDEVNVLDISKHRIWVITRVSRCHHVNDNYFSLVRKSRLDCLSHMLIDLVKIELKICLKKKFAFRFIVCKDRIRLPR